MEPIKYLTLQLEGHILGDPIISLVENRATNNFIDEIFIFRRDFKRVETKEFRFINARGYNTWCTWMIQYLEVTLRNYTTQDHLYVYPMGGFPHIILGFQWLYQLGDVSFNLEMNFF